MNEHFITGFVKAAKATGMNDTEIEALLKQAEPGAMPQEEMPEEMPAEMPAEMPEAPMDEAGGDQELDQLLAQLSPEEIEQLAQELANEMEGGAPEGDSAELEQIPELAAAIEQQLGQNPEVAEATAPAPEMPEEVMAKQSAINFIKSAEYVEGFLEQAVGRGMNLKQAVELYDTAFSTTFQQLKTSELKGDQHKLDLNNNNKVDAEDLKNLRAGKKDKVDEKTAAYYEGVLERCREYGLSDEQAIDFVKSAAPLQSAFQAAMSRGKGMASKGKNMASETASKAKNVASDVFEKAKTTTKKHQLAAGAAGGLAVGGVAGHAIGATGKKDEE